MVRILVVDDDRSVAYSIKTLLEYEGFDVAVAEDGGSAIVAAQAALYDVVIVDIFMPGMDGLETIAALRRDQPDLPIIAISGFTLRDQEAPLTDVLAKAMHLGASCTLHKPFRRRDILDAVTACLDRAGARANDAA